MPVGGVIRIGRHTIGEGCPVYVVAEIGQNHNGDTALARRLINVAAAAGAQAVKFQKRTPEIAVPDHLKMATRHTPWGTMTYLQYRKRVELPPVALAELFEYAASCGLDWFASAWDEPSLAVLEGLGARIHKIASACVTDLPLLRAAAATGKPIFLSTGMSTIQEVDKAVAILGADRLLLMHATSAYPLTPDEANLRMIQTLADRYDVPIGYSGHEEGTALSVAAVALGAVAVERHITLDKTMWGSDHAASLEPQEFQNQINAIRVVERGLGDGIKRVYPSEYAAMRRLRRFHGGGPDVH